MTEAQKMNTKIKIGPALGSYANIFKPRAANEKSEPKYSISLLFPKNLDLTTPAGKSFAEMRAIMEKLALLKHGPKWKGIPYFKFGIRDGDVDRPEQKEYAGKWFINASSKRPVGIVDRKRMPVLSESEAYSGCIYIASINLYAFDKDGGKGVTAGLNNLMVWEKGERIDGRLDAGDDFAEYGEGSAGGDTEVAPNALD